MEIHNGGILHASNHLIERFGTSQHHFLENLGVGERYAFLEQNFAPPNLRRNLGVQEFLSAHIAVASHTVHNDGESAHNA